jgi:hypothetical protein
MKKLSFFLLSLLFGLTAMALSMSSDAPFWARALSERIEKNSYSETEALLWFRWLISDQYEIRSRTSEPIDPAYILQQAEQLSKNTPNTVASSDIRDVAMLCIKYYKSHPYISSLLEKLNDEDAPIVAKAMADAGRFDEAKLCLNAIHVTYPKLIPYAAEAYKLIGDEAKSNEMLENALSQNSDPGKYDVTGRVIIAKYLNSKSESNSLNQSEVKLLTKYMDNIVGKAQDLDVKDCIWLINVLNASSDSKNQEKARKILSKLSSRSMSCKDLLLMAKYYNSINNATETEGFVKAAEKVVNRCPFLILNYFDGYAGVYGTEKAIDKLEQYYDTYSGWINGRKAPTENTRFYFDLRNSVAFYQLIAQMENVLDCNGSNVKIDKYKELLSQKKIDIISAINTYAAMKVQNGDNASNQEILALLKDYIIQFTAYSNTDQIANIIETFYINRNTLGDEAAELIRSNKSVMDTSGVCNALEIFLQSGKKDVLAWCYPIVIDSIDNAYATHSDKSYSDYYDDLLSRVNDAIGGSSSFVVGDFKYQLYRNRWAAEYIGNGSTVTFPTTITNNGQTYNIQAVYGAKGNKNLVSVVIPNGIEKISENAFDGCEKLTTVTIPASKIQIGKLAFANCPALTTITNLNFTKDIDDPEQSWDYFLRTCYKSIKMLDSFYKQLIAKYTQDNLHNSANRLMDGYLEGEYYWYIQRKNYGSTSSHEMGSRVLLNIAAKGNIKAMRDICYYYIKLEMNYGGPIAAADYLKYAKLLITKKPAWGYFYMGMAYEFGLGVTPSRSTAHSYYAKGRELNDSDCIKGWNRTW